MVLDLSYTTINNVFESWELLKRNKGLEKEFGIKLFQRLFEKSPPAKVLFGYPIDLDVNSSELLKSKRFNTHASTVFDMLDTAFNMLGPDIELLMEIMNELGSKHIVYGVTPQMFPFMEEAILFALEECLGERITPNVRQSWIETYQFLSHHMLKPYKTKC